MGNTSIYIRSIDIYIIWVLFSCLVKNKCLCELPQRRNILKGCFLITIDIGPAGNFPEDQAQGPDVSLLVRLKDVHSNSLIQHLRGHVALGPHARVIAHIEVVMGLRVYHGQTWGKSRHGAEMQLITLT